MISCSFGIIAIYCVAASVVNGFTFTPVFSYTAPSLKQQWQQQHEHAFTIGRKATSTLSMTGTLEAPAATDLAIRYVAGLDKFLARFSRCSFICLDSLDLIHCSQIYLFILSKKYCSDCPC
jgi:multidrug efflux pump subunit AcrB